MATGWRHALGTGALGLGLLAAGSWVQGFLPDDEDDPGAAPHLVGGGVGDALDLRTATVTVDEVLGSTTVEEFGSELVSPGVWVVVRYSVVATEENTSITFAELRDAEGRVWGLDGRNGNDCVDSPPGLPAHCTVFVEVPPDALPTLTVRLARLSKDTRFDAVAEVDLGLTSADAARFAAAPTVVIPQATLGDEPPETQPEETS